MAISKIKTGSITDSAVNTDKLAPGSVGSTDLSATAITGQTELSETAADTDFTIIYDTSSGTLKKILRSNLKQQGPTISSVSPTNANESDGPTITFTITGTGFTAGSSARLIGNLGKIQEFDTVTRSSATSITATIAFTTLEQGQEPYDVQVTNGEGISSLLANQINVNASPVFVTAAGSLGSMTGDATDSFSVNATDPDSAGNVTFELQSGTIPPGLSLSNTAADGGTAIISGTADNPASDTTFNFVLRAIDNASNTSSRSFSITVNRNIQYQSFTSSGTFAIPSGTSTIEEVLVVAGGGGGGRARPSNNPSQGSGGGGAGGLIFFPCYPVTPGGTITVTVGCGGGEATNGQDSVFGSPTDPGLGQGGVLTAKGGGGGGNNYPGTVPTNGLQGGSGGGGKSGVPGSNAQQPTQPGNSGSYGFGNNGGSGTSTPRHSGGGGGGAGAAGSNAPGSAGGNGGIGKAYTIADGTTSVYYGGGGGGGLSGCPGNAPWPPSYPGGTGGQGGGANGAALGGGRNIGGSQASANTGGGGGGGSSAEGNNNATGGGGGTGGKGIVIVKY